MYERTARSIRQEEMRLRQHDWLKKARDHSGLSFTEMSRRSGLSPGAINRMINDEDRAQVMNTSTIASIAEATGFAATADLFGAPVAVTAFKEPEAAPYQHAPDDALSTTVAALVNSPNRFAYTLKSDALVHEGYRPGDIVIVDMDARPVEKDIVCVQFYARNDQERTETVFRLLSRRYLVTAGPYDTLREPREMMDASIKVMGTVIATLRRRPG